VVLAGAVARWLPVAAAWIACVLAAVRVVSSEDLGYHLAYGRHLLDAGRPLDHDANLYTLPPADLPPEARPAPGPGCWYDDQGRYRFANANWLSQGLLALVERAGGIGGLSALLVVSVAMLAGLMVAVMVRLSVPPALIAVVLMAFTLMSWARLTLRPELFGYVVLAAQAFVLAGSWRDGRLGRPLPWRSVVMLIALQGLLVNLHGYFLLGIAMTGAALFGGLAQREGWHRRAGRLAVACGGQVVACFVNPWGWRLAALPLQTVAFMRDNRLSAGPSEHPWSSMGDLQRTGFPGAGAVGVDPASLALLAGLGLALAGALVAARRRRWDWLLLIAGMTLVAFSAQRNVAVGMGVAMLFAAAAVATCRAPGWWSAWVASPGGRVARGGALAALLAAAATLGWSLVTSRLYVRLDSPIRFGTGLSTVNLPIGAARWIAQHRVTGNIWAAPTCSSTIYGFAGTAPKLNMVTNTWAYPPDVMRWLLATGGSYRPQPFAPAAEALDVSVVVTPPGGLLRQLAADRRWVTVCVDGPFAVLVRRDGPDAALARPAALDDREIDELIGRILAADPAPASTMAQTGRLLIDLGRPDAALAVLTAARRAGAASPGVWIETANALTRRARDRRPGELQAVRDDLAATGFALGQAARLTGSPQLRDDLLLIQGQLDAIDAAIAAVP